MPPRDIDQRVNVTGDAKQKLGEIADAAKKVNDANEEGAAKTQRAERAERTRRQQLGGMRNHLERLARAQQRYEDTTESGTRATDVQRRAAERRERQMRRLARTLSEEERAQRRANRTIREASGDFNEASRSTDGFVRSLGGIAGGITVIAALRAALRLYLDELEQVKEAQSDAFQNQTTVASAERSLKLNLAGASDDQVQQALDASRQIARDNNVPIAQTTEALASALSSRGGNLDEAIAFTTLAAQVRPDRPDEIAGIAGAIGDVSDATGITDPEAALGFLLAVGAQSRVADFGLQARNIPAALAGITGQDFKPGEAGALFSALSVGAKDLTGESSRTASIQLAEQINTFFANRQRPEEGAAAIATLQQDEALRSDFLNDLSLETRFRAPATDLVSDTSSSIAQGFNQNLGGFGEASQLRQAALTQLERLRTGELEANVELNRELASVVDQLSADNVTFGTVGAIRDELTDLLKQSGSSKLTSRLTDLSFDLDSFDSPDDAIDKIIRILKSRTKEIRDRAVETTIDSNLNKQFTRRRLTVSERQAIETINEAIRSIEENRGQDAGDLFIESSLLRFGDNSRFKRPEAEARREALETGGIELDDPNVIQASRSPQTVIQNQTINNGTIIQGTRDPIDGDFTGEDR
ncbi:MAG: hypothetical protein AAF711_00660 [Planctomycetota bacterium]